MRRRLFHYSVPLLTGLLLSVQLVNVTTKGVLLAKPRPGKIKGQVCDINRARVINALVIVDGFETHHQLVTDENGEFEISLRPGVYQISVEANGFRRFFSGETEVKAGKTRTIEIQLKVSSGVMLAPATAGND